MLLLLRCVKGHISTLSAGGTALVRCPRATASAALPHRQPATPGAVFDPAPDPASSRRSALGFDRDRPVRNPPDPLTRGSSSRRPREQPDTLVIRSPRRFRSDAPATCRGAASGRRRSAVRGTERPDPRRRRACVPARRHGGRRARPRPRRVAARPSSRPAGQTRRAIESASPATWSANSAGGQSRTRSTSPILSARAAPTGRALPGKPRGGFRSDPAWKGVRPVLGAVQPHQPVVRIEDGTGTAPHFVGGERQHHPTRGRVAGQRRDHQAVRGGEDLLHQVVDGLDVGQRLGRGVRCRLDEAQVDAVGEEVPAPAEDETSTGRPRAWRYAACSRRHWSVPMAPPGNEKRTKPTGPRSS